MDIGEFSIYNACLSSALIGLIAINPEGGVESPRVSRVNMFSLKMATISVIIQTLYIHMIFIEGSR